MLALGWTAGVLVIALAVLMALTQLLLPLVARHPQWVAAQLSARAQRPVSFTSMEGRWTPSGPLLVLHGVVVGAPTGQSAAPLRLPESELRLDFGGWLLPSRHLLNVHVRGLQLDLSHERDGAWRINGIGVAGDTTRQPLTLGRLSVDLWLEDLRVEITDVAADQHYTLLARQLRVSRQGSGRIRMGGALRRAGVPTVLHAIGDFRDDGNSGRLWVALDDAELQPLLANVDIHGYRLSRGRGRVTAWLEWRDGKLLAALMRLDVDALSVSTLTADADVSSVSLGTMHGLADMRRSADGYRLRWAGDDHSAAVVAVHQPGTPGTSVGVAARQWPLAQWLPLLALKPGLNPAVGNWLQHGHPRGVLAGASVRWNQIGGLHALEATFVDLGIDAVGKLPGLRQLHGVVRGDAQALTLEFPPQASELNLPSLFRHPLELSNLAGTLAFWKQDGAWILGMDALDFSGAGYAGQLRGELAFPERGGLPVADLYATLEHAEVPAAKLFWPLGSMSPATMTWLDRALVAGTIDRAQVVLRGDLAQWPFREHAGRFEAHVPVRGLTLDYAVGWPRAEDVEVVADFINNSMHAVVSGGQSLGVRTDQAVADIADFGTAALDLSVRGSGSGGNVMEFVAKSPIGSAQVETLNKLKLGGAATFALHLRLPLHDDGPPQLDGSAQLTAADLSAPAWNLKLDKITGPVHFDTHGVGASSLQSVFHGQPAALAFAIGDVAGHADTTVWAQVQGAWSLGDLVQEYPSLQWIGQASSGISNFTIGYTLARGPGAQQRVTIDSNLQGSTLNLPLPLHKASAAGLPLHVTLGLPIAGSDLQITWGRAAHARFRLADATRPLAGVLAFGEQMPQDMPAEGLAIRGHADPLDVTGWVQRTVGGSDNDSGTPALQGIHVATDHALWFGRPLGAMQIDATRQADSLKFSVAGPAMAGTIVVPGSDLKRLGITARMQRLYWPKTVEASPAGAGQATPADGAHAAVVAAVPDNPADTGINPAALPPMHLWISDLRLGESRLGDARLESWPTAQGMHVEQLRALSKDVQITASGDWNGSAHDSHTRMRINFSAEDLGAMLGAFGFDGLVDGGKTHALIDGRWPGSPTAFSLATMDGSLNVKVQGGRIPDAASPGVGRLLGLVSLTELPRRLTLDFGDVFGKGLAFDSITGDFRLAGGNATTNNLAIIGSSADISISGRTGLRTRDYDQQLHVVPHVGNSLPLVGAVVGGPVGAAAGFAMQSLLGKGLNRAAGVSYRITGSWDKPVMTLVEKHGVPVSPRQVSPADTGTTATPASPLPPAPALVPASPASTLPAPAASGH